MSHKNWQTPHELFNILNDEFSFDIDVAASKENTLVPDCFITAEEDALKTPWLCDSAFVTAAFCNPPYTLIGPFIQRAWEQTQAHHMTTVLLIPAYTDTQYWFDYVTKAHEVRFLKGRVRFINGDSLQKPSPAMFPSVVVVNKWLTGQQYGKAPNQFVWDWKIR